MKRDSNGVLYLDNGQAPKEPIRQETSVEATAPQLESETKEPESLEKTALAPISAVRSPTTSKKEQSGSAIVSEHLAPQLGSAPKFLSNQEIDERKLGVLNEMATISLFHFHFRGVIDGVNYYERLVDWELVSSQGVNGIARRHILQSIAAASGAQVRETVKRPNLIARNTYARDWEKQAMKEGKIPEGMGEYE